MIKYKRDFNKFVTIKTNYPVYIFCLNFILNYVNYIIKIC
jgi:hypothetical protein